MALTWNVGYYLLLQTLFQVDNQSEHDTIHPQQIYKFSSDTCSLFFKLV